MPGVGGSTIGMNIDRSNAAEPGGPLVSVIVPVHDAETAIEETLRSVALQVYRHFEVLVVDAGPRDKVSAAVADFCERDPRFTLYHRSGASLAAARNFGVARAKGAFIAPLNADDLWHPHYLKRMVTRALQAPQAGLIRSRARRIDVRSHVLGDQAGAEPCASTLLQLLHGELGGSDSAILVARSAMLSAGGYDEGLSALDLEGAENYVLQLRIAAHFQFASEPGFLVGSRVAPGRSISDPNRQRGLQDAAVDILRGDRLLPPAVNLMRWREGKDLLALARRTARHGNYAESIAILARALKRDPVRSALAAAQYLHDRISSWIPFKTKPSRPHFFDCEIDQEFDRRRRLLGRLDGRRLSRLERLDSDFPYLSARTGGEDMTGHPDTNDEITAKPRAPQSPGEPHGETTRRARDALARGLDFLMRSQLPDGQFRVLTSPSATLSVDCVADSSVFATALVADALKNVAGTAAMQERALDFLLTEMDANGLWRHWTRDHPRYRLLPPDLDDTACVSAILASRGRTIIDNRPLMLANRNRRGLFYTWVAPRAGPILRWRAVLSQLLHPAALHWIFTKTPARPHDVDAGVNANVLYYLGARPGTRPVVTYLLDVIRADAETRSDKWYDNRFVMYYFLARALAPVSATGVRRIREKVGISLPSSVLDRAICSAVYARLGSRCPAADIEMLCADQEEDGSWPRGAVYHGGRRRLAAGRFGTTAPDMVRWGSEELTTAFAVEGLSYWLDASPVCTDAPGS